LREPSVGEFGTEPAFVSNSRKQRKPRQRQREQVVALRAEFVLKPGQEERVCETIDAILENSFGGGEFLQALVLVSELESRLVTVLTFWRSDGFGEARERRVNWLRQKLAPYVDQTLRVQTYSARVTEARQEATPAQTVSLVDSYSTHCEARAATN